MHLNENYPFLWLVLSKNTTSQAFHGIPQHGQVEIVYEVAGDDGSISRGFIETLRHLQTKPYAPYLFVISQYGTESPVADLTPISTFLDQVR